MAYIDYQVHVKHQWMLCGVLELRFEGMRVPRCAVWLFPSLTSLYPNLWHAITAKELASDQISQDSALLKNLYGHLLYIMQTYFYTSVQGLQH